MKKSTEELILSEIIQLKTEVLRTNSRLGYIEEDIKEIKADIIDIRKDLDEVKGEIVEINRKLDWVGEKVFEDHERRIGKLEQMVVVA